MTVWLSRELILAIHDEQLAAHGGTPGLRDPGLLESAFARPLNRVGYGAPDSAELAAVHAIGLIARHPFVDGNKRTAYVALETFLALNGLRFPVTDADAVVTVLRLAAGDIADGEFIAWVRRHAEPPADGPTG
ncbi:MAG: type II toxin-antitoxin system death-on-curing family toxin [Acetobacteraceae bacterium]